MWWFADRMWWFWAGLTDVGVLGGEWARESGVGRIEGVGLMS